MLRFTVFQGDGPAPEWPVTNAHLLGPDDSAVRGDIRFESGQIVCHKRGSQACGLCLQHDAGRAGRLMLQTCLLPDRDEPYLLTVELARHRIKTFLAKSEEWQMFDLSLAHPAVEQWEKAREEFTAALTAEDPVEGSRAADSSLIDAIEATERLAMAHAEILLHRRYAQRAASSATLGVRVWPERDARPLRDLVAKEFDLVSIPLRWRELEIEEGKYRWEPVDRWMEWARKEGKPIVAGPLLDFSKRALPDWMYVWQHDYDTCRDLVYDHIERVVNRYRATVGMWNLGCGLNVNGNFVFSAEQMVDLVRMASLLVRQVRRGARTMIELEQPFGEFVGVNPESISTIAFLDGLVQGGIRLDAVGLRLLFGGGTPGIAARDLMQISSVLDKLFLTELPVLVSAMGVPSEEVSPTGGTWRDGWSDDVQARWVTRMFALALSKPYVESLFWTDLYDHAAAELPHAALISPRGKAKPAMQRLISLRRRLRKPLGALENPQVENPS
jgi:hypothetical protein